MSDRWTANVRPVKLDAAPFVRSVQAVGEVHGGIVAQQIARDHLDAEEVARWLQSRQTREA